MRSFLARLRTRPRKSTRSAVQAARPSFHPSFEQLESRIVPTMTFHGGTLLTNVDVQAIFLGADWQNNPTLNAQTGDIANFLTYIVNSPYMDMLTNAGYGVGRGSYLDGTIDPTDLSNGVTDDTVQNEILNEIGNGTLQPPDDNNLYFVYIQPGLSIVNSSGDDPGVGAGYHTWFTAPDGSQINYAVVTSNVDPTTGAADWGNIGITGTHELAESVTDSGNGWWDDDLTDQQAALGLGTEIGDIVNGQAVILNGYYVQKVADQNDIPIQPAGSTSLVPSGQDVTATAEQPFSGTVATFQELDVPGVYGDYSYGDYSAQIAWGDGQTSAGQITDNGDGTFNVTGTNTYAQSGSYPIQVSLTDSGDGDTAATSSTATVNPGNLRISGQDVTATTGQPWTATVATFQDVDGTGSVGDYTAQLDYGDGNTGAGQIVDNGDGTYNIVGSDTYNLAGTYTINVSLTDNGDGDTAMASVTATVTGPAATGTAVAANPATPVYGYPFTLTASVTSAGGVPVGTVSFLDGTTPLGAAPVNAGGTAMLTVTTLAPGNHTILAVFNGSNFFGSSTSPPAEVTVLTATSTGLAASPTQAIIGQPITLSVGVIAGATVPTGTVTFLESGYPIGTVPLGPYGNATLNVTGLGSGSYSFTAQFNGTGDFASSTSQAVTARVSLVSGATPGVYDPTTGIWYLRNSNTLGPPDAGNFAYGGPGYLPVVGDWTGDGVATVGVYQEATGTWLLKNSNTPGAPDIAFAYGGPGYLPVVGDWNGDGIDTVGVYNVATGQWLLRNSNTSGAPDISFAYGGPGYLPVVGDWTGSGKTTVGVYLEADGAWLLKNSNTSGAPDISFAYGGPGYLPVVGDWNSDGITTVGLFSTVWGSWLLKNSNTSGPPDVAFAYGLGSWTPVAGAWTAQPQTAARVVRLGSDAASTAAAPEATAMATVDELIAAGVDAALTQRRSAADNELAALLEGVPPTKALDQVFAAGGTATA